MRFGVSWIKVCGQGCVLQRSLAARRHLRKAMLEVLLELRFARQRRRLELRPQLRARRRGEPVACADRLTPPGIGTWTQLCSGQREEF